MLAWIEELEKLRLVNNWTSVELARQLDVSKQYVSAVARGEKQPSDALKLLVWSKLGYSLNRDALLAFLPLPVALELLDLEAQGGKRVPDAVYDQGAVKDWVEDLILLIAASGMRHGEFAASIGVHSSYLSNVVHGKNTVTWPIKLAVWNMRRYDLSENSIFNLLAPDVSLALRKYELEHQDEPKQAPVRVVRDGDAAAELMQIINRVTQPTPAQVRETRIRAGLTQAQAVAMVSGADQSVRSWQHYEAEQDKEGARVIPLALWELFLLVSGQHPKFVMTARDAK